MVSAKLIMGLALGLAFVYIVTQTELGRNAVSEIKKLGGDAKSFTQKTIDKIDGKTEKKAETA